MIDFHTFKLGLEVVLAVRWRLAAKLQSPFGSMTTILCKWSIEISHLSLTLGKLFDCFDLTGNLTIRFQSMQFWGILTQECNFI
jgi:hypothetical protein